MNGLQREGGDVVVSVQAEGTAPAKAQRYETAKGHLRNYCIKKREVLAGKTDGADQRKP